MINNHMALDIKLNAYFFGFLLMLFIDVIFFKPDVTFSSKITLEHFHKWYLIVSHTKNIQK